MSTNEQNAVIDTQNQAADAAVPADQLEEVGGGTEHNGVYNFFHDVSYGLTTMYNGAVNATTDAMCSVTGNC